MRVNGRGTTASIPRTGVPHAHFPAHKTVELNFPPVSTDRTFDAEYERREASESSGADARNHRPAGCAAALRQAEEHHYRPACQTVMGQAAARAAQIVERYRT